jgi:hypothetical protein
MIPRAEGTIHAEKTSPLHPCRLSANMTAKAVFKAATMISDGLGLRNCSRGIGESSSASALESMVSMTCYGNAYKFDIPMPMAMAMALMCSEWKPPSMLKIQDNTYTMIANFTEITVSNSDNDLHLVQVMSARLEGWMPDIPEGQIWRTVSLSMFLLSLFFCFVYYFTSLDLGPVQMASARVFANSGDKSREGGVSPCAGSSKWLTHGTDRLWDLWVRTFANIERLFDCCHSFLLLYRIMQPRGSAPKEGANVMARLHVMCPGPGNPHFI